MTQSNGSPFKIVVPAKERAKLKRWGGWAAGAGLTDDYLASLKVINFHLGVDPMVWGAPRYSLKKLSLTVCFGTFKMLNVWYGVNTARHIVFVQAFQFRGDYPHGQPPEG